MTMLYDLLNRNGDPPKRRFYWNFSEWHPETAYTWHECDAVGGGITLETNFTSPNGGLGLKTASQNDAGGVNKNGALMFSNKSVFLTTAKKSVLDSAINGGLRASNGDVQNPPSQCSEFHNNSGYTNIALVTGDTSSVSAAQSSTVDDTDWHNYRIDLNGTTNNTLTLDGVLIITKTSNLPPSINRYQPALYAQQRSASAMTGYYRYCEVFDK